MTFSINAPARSRASSGFLRIAMVSGAALMLAGCYSKRDMVGDIPHDVRQRHPIAITEGPRSVEVFVGTRRGGLTPTQRAEVLAFAQSWKRDATGGILIDTPATTGNARASHEAMQEIRSIMAAAQIPPKAILARPYSPPDSRQLAPIKIHYPRVMADVGPCGLWPHDLGASYDPIRAQNTQYWNFGCANQRNLASMVAEPADLVQPRASTPSYTARRSFAIDKYRQGQSPATTYTDSQQGKISELGQ
jgi:pilus assembly protein CpaD